MYSDADDYSCNLDFNLVVDSHYVQQFLPSGHYCGQLLNVNAQMTISAQLQRLELIRLISFYHKEEIMHELSCLRAKRLFLADDNEHASQESLNPTSSVYVELLTLLSSSSQSKKKRKKKGTQASLSKDKYSVGDFGEPG